MLIAAVLEPLQVAFGYTAITAISLALAAAARLARTSAHIGLSRGLTRRRGVGPERFRDVRLVFVFVFLFPFFLIDALINGS